MLSRMATFCPVTTAVPGSTRTRQTLAVTAERYQNQIEAVRTSPGQDKKSLAKALGICEGTLRKRLKFIQEHLCKPTPTASPTSPPA